MAEDIVIKLTAELFKTLGHPVRIKILHMLADGERCVCEMIEEIDIEQSNFSQHLGVLKKQGLIDSRKDGQRVIYWIASIRPFTIGRKNWLFSGSPKGTAASAAIYSIIETAKANGLNPYNYLKFIFRDLPGVQFRQYPEFLEDYLPWNPEAQAKCTERKA